MADPQTKLINLNHDLMSHTDVIRMARLLTTKRAFMDWFTHGTNVVCKETVYEVCAPTVVKRVVAGSLLLLSSRVGHDICPGGMFDGGTLSDIDEITGVPGLGEAMLEVYWIEEVEDGLYLPKFNIFGIERGI